MYSYRKWIWVETKCEVSREVSKLKRGEDAIYDAVVKGKSIQKERKR